MTAAADPNAVAVELAGVDDAHARWLGEVAHMVEPRLDAVRPDWRGLPDAPVLRAAAFGLLLGLLSRRYPATREVLFAVAEAHPSYDAFPPTRRLATLEQLSSSEQLTVQWIGGLFGTDDPARMRPLCALDDHGSTGAEPGSA